MLHGDNGATLKAATVLAMLHWLGIKPPDSRPRMSDDNAYAESLFRAAKYRPAFPAKGFANLDEARDWAGQFAHWYNVEHRHTGIGYVTPAQRHVGEGRDVLASRHALYTQACTANPRPLVGRRARLDTARCRHLEPRARLGYQRGNRRQTSQQRIGTTQATTTLTRAGVSKAWLGSAV